MKNEILSCIHTNVSSQTFRAPPPPPGIPRDGALRCPHYHSPEDLNFEQRDQGFSDFVMHFRQPEVPKHLVLN